MLSYHNRAKLLNRTNLSIFTLILLISILLFAQIPKTQAAAPNPDLQEKALSFLREVIQLDMAKYTVALNDKYSGPEHLSYNLNLANASFLDSRSYRVDAVFSFYDGVLGSCSLYPGNGGLLYLHPEQDHFNATLGIVERYQTWTNDSQVHEMANLLRNVGSEKNATEVSGNLTLRLSVLHYTQYAFYNTFNGTDYTGLTIFRGTTDLDFADSRVYEKIGNTSVNISKEQAINIASNYVKNYSYNATLGNRTTITVSNLNVTGVYAARLQTAVKENSTLFPYWEVMLNVSNMPAPGLQGLEVKIWANDGTVASVIGFSTANIAPLIDMLLFYPLYSSLLMGLIFVILCAVAIVVVLLLVLGRSNKK